MYMVYIHTMYLRDKGWVPKSLNCLFRCTNVYYIVCGYKMKYICKVQTPTSPSMGVQSRLTNEVSEEENRRTNDWVSKQKCTCMYVHLKYSYSFPWFVCTHIEECLCAWKRESAHRQMMQIRDVTGKPQWEKFLHFTFPRVLSSMAWRIVPDLSKRHETWRPK
jgi:hypothetical protein